MSDKSVVLSIFPNEPAADEAVKALKLWGKNDGRVNLNAIGVLVLDDNGNVKTHKIGSRSTLKGLGIGYLLALLIPPAGIAAGVIGGGVLGVMHRKGLGMSDKEREALTTKLYDGKAAVGVLAKGDSAQLIAAKLVELGGEPSIHAVADESVNYNEPDTPATYLPTSNQ